MKLITILLIFLSIASFGQKKGRAISAAKIDVGRIDSITYDINTDILSVVEDGLVFETEIPTYKIDTVYISTGDTLVIDEEGKVWKVGLPSTAPQTLSWNPGAEQISISGGNTIDLSGTYGLLAGSNTWTGVVQTLSASQTSLLFKDGPVLQGELIGTSAGLLIRAGSSTKYVRLFADNNTGIEVKDAGVFADLDAGTSSNVVYQQADGELTVGAAPSGSSLWTDGGTTTYLTATGDNVRIGSSSPTTYKFQVDGTSLFTSVVDLKSTGNRLEWSDESSWIQAITYNTESSLGLFSGGFLSVIVNPDMDIHFVDYGSGNHTGTAAYNLEVNSNGEIIETTAGSDFRMKENFRTLNGSLGKILSINTYAFDWITAEQLPKKAQDVEFDIKVDQDWKPRESAGVIAQEIKEIIPEAVKQYNNGYYKVDYEAIVPHLIEAIKEQQKQIEFLLEKIHETN